MDVKLHKNLQEIEHPGKLILIASLLEKIANLGGLSRTAAVQVGFGRNSSERIYTIEIIEFLCVSGCNE